MSVSPSEPSLKERIERKRRNDAIKTKELNQLRTILGNGRGIKRSDATDLATPSVLVRTSGMGSLERNSILDKIDGAEAHLENWWGTTTVPAPMATAPLQHGKAATDPRPPLKTPAPTGPAAFLDDMDLDFTDMLGGTEPQPARPSPLPSAPAAAEEVPLSALKTCLRDAALHYAEAEFADAQQILAGMLRDASLAPEAVEALTFALFEVYRCTGQQDRFDALALDYAKRYGRSPGEWFSLEEPEAPPGAEDAAPESGFSALAQETTWECPAILDKRALADCIARNPATASVSFINWEALQHIDNAIAPALAGQLQIWCGHPVELHWSGMDALLAAVQMCKVSGDAARDAAWWLIHLDLLCIQQQAQAYEDMAMDYCIAFEVSPPSWQPPQCKLIPDGESAVSLDYACTAASRDFEEAQASRSPYTSCELQGHLTGEARRALRALRAASGSVGQITVSCSRLGRVDFTAASALLNWAAKSDAKGCQVQFVQLPRMVLVFFEMLGMHKVAKLSAGTH